MLCALGLICACFLEPGLAVRKGPPWKCSTWGCCLSGDYSGSAQGLGKRTSHKSLWGSEYRKPKPSRNPAYPGQVGLWPAHPFSEAGLPFSSGNALCFPFLPFPPSRLTSTNLSPTNFPSLQILEVVTCLTSWYRSLWDIEKKQFFLFCPAKWSDYKCGSLHALPRTCYAASGFLLKLLLKWDRCLLCLCRLLGLSLLFHSKSFEEPLEMILPSTMLDRTVFHYLDFTGSVYSLLFHYRILVYHLSL